MKVKVSKEVAELLDKAKKKYIGQNIIRFISEVMNLIYPLSISSDIWMEKHNLTDEDLINAYKYGWEVEYEYKENDIVHIPSYKKDVCYIITKEDIERGLMQKRFTLVCKAENREDLKQ